MLQGGHEKGGKMSRSQYSWSRYGRNTASTSSILHANNSRGAPAAAEQAVYDQEEDSAGGGLVGLGSSTWIVAEACKVKDALFLGNVMAVQDSNFLTMNKIGYSTKVQILTQLLVQKHKY